MLLTVSALFLRVGWMALLPTLPDGDENHYLRLIENLAERHAFADGPGEPRENHLGPLYPLLAAALVSLGLHGEAAARMVSLLASAITVGVVFHLGSRIWGRRGGLAAGLAAMVHPASLSAAKHIYPEATSSLWLMVAMGSLTSRWPGPIFGASLALAALTRREAILLLPLGALLAALRPARSMSAHNMRVSQESAGSGRPRWIQLIAALVAFTVVFFPYLCYLRTVTGHWTLSGQFLFAFALGRLMELHPDRGISREEIRQWRIAYPSAQSYFLANPASCSAALFGTTATHLRNAWFGHLGWPLGIPALVALLVAVRRGRLSGWLLTLLLMPFLLVFAWSIAGPIGRYSKALAPCVSLWFGAIPAIGAAQTERAKKSEIVPNRSAAC